MDPLEYAFWNQQQRHLSIAINLMLHELASGFDATEEGFKEWKLEVNNLVRQQEFTKKKLAELYRQDQESAQES